MNFKLDFIYILECVLESSTDFLATMVALACKTVSKLKPATEAIYLIMAVASVSTGSVIAGCEKKRSRGELYHSCESVLSLTLC